MNALNSSWSATFSTGMLVSHIAHLLHLTFLHWPIFPLLSILHHLVPAANVVQVQITLTASWKSCTSLGCKSTHRLWLMLPQGTLLERMWFPVPCSALTVDHLLPPATLSSMTGLAPPNTFIPPPWWHLMIHLLSKKINQIEPQPNRLVSCEGMMKDDKFSAKLVEDHCQSFKLSVNGDQRICYQPYVCHANPNNSHPNPAPCRYRHWLIHWLAVDTNHQTVLHSWIEEMPQKYPLLQWSQKQQADVCYHHLPGGTQQWWYRPFLLYCGCTNVPGMRWHVRKEILYQTYTTPALGDLGLWRWASSRRWG